MRIAANLCAAGCFLVSAAAAQTAGLQIVESPTPVLVADKTGNASITVTLKNISGNTLTPQLTVDPFSYKRPDGATYPTPATATFTGAPTSLAQGGTAQVKIAVSGLSDAGEATSILRNGGVQFADLTAIRTPATYTVQIDGSNEAVFAPDSQPSVTLKNTDPMTYRFLWTLEVDGRSWSGGPVDVAASGTALVNLSAAKPEAGLFESGTIKDKVASGFLVLNPQLPAGTPLQSPVRLPVKIRVRYWGSIGQAIWEFGTTALLLLLGAVGSLLFRYFIPNAFGTIKLRRQLRGMDQRLRGIGNGIASQWRVLLASKISECHRRYRELWIVFPAYGTRLTEVKAAADMYNQWLDVAYNVSNVLEGARRKMQTGMPPTVMAWIERECEEALSPIASGFTKPDELQAMQTALKAAAGYVKALVEGSPVPDLEQEIKTREDALKNELTDLENGFPGFAGMLKQVGACVGTPVTADQYTNRDTFSVQAEMLCEYRDLVLRRGATTFPPPAKAAAATAGSASGGVSTPPPTALDRMLAREADLLSYVQPEAYGTLRIAVIKLEEMKKDFYPMALEDEVKDKPPSVEVCADPSPIEVKAPIRFSMRFVRQELNEQAAIQEWSCHWDFGDGTQTEIGWDVFHSFDAPGPRTITVKLFDLRGNAVPTGDEIKHSIDVVGPKGKEQNWLRKVTPESRVEALQLSFVLVLAISGIWATARGKVETMSGPGAALTLIGIGFGADSLKNLMTQKPGEQ